jgi:hypothetical protein
MRDLFQILNDARRRGSIDFASAGRSHHRQGRLVEAIIALRRNWRTAIEVHAPRQRDRVVSQAGAPALYRIHEGPTCWAGSSRVHLGHSALAALLNAPAAHPVKRSSRFDKPEEKPIAFLIARCRRRDTRR